MSRYLHNGNPVCLGLSLGQSRGRRAAEKVYVLKVYVPFSLATYNKMTLKWLFLPLFSGAFWTFTIITPKASQNRLRRFLQKLRSYHSEVPKVLSVALVEKGPSKKTKAPSPIVGSALLEVVWKGNLVRFPGFGDCCLFRGEIGWIHSQSFSGVLPEFHPGIPSRVEGYHPCQNHYTHEINTFEWFSGSQLQLLGVFLINLQHIYSFLVLLAECSCRKKNPSWIFKEIAVTVTRFNVFQI